MILDFNSYIINEGIVKKLKREVHGVLNMSARKKMRKVLRHNIVTFKFKKRNGDLRIAHGTLHPDYLPKLRGGAPKPERQMVYFDLDKEGWRSFRSYSFIKILNVKSVDDYELVKKPKSKPVKSEPEEEETKKKSITSEEEETKKPIESEEEKETKKKPVPKKKEEKEPESILDDKDTPEEEEVIKKDNEEEDEKKEKDKDKK